MLYYFNKNHTTKYSTFFNDQLFTQTHGFYVDVEADVNVQTDVQV